MGKEIVLRAIMQRLVHSQLRAPSFYPRLIKGHQRDEYTFKAAIALEEAQTLIELGFEYVTDLKQRETIYKLFTGKGSRGNHVRKTT